MKKIKVIIFIILIAVLCLALSACAQDEVNLIIEYEKIDVTKDATPIYYVQVSMMITGAEDGIEFNASDFSILRNGVKENGTAFIVSTSYEEVGGNKTYTSVTEPTFKIENYTGSHLQVVFTGNDNITEFYYKDIKISLT